MRRGGFTEYPSDSNVIPIRPGLGVGMPSFLDLAQEWLEAEASQHARPSDARVHVEHLKSLWRLTERELKPAIAKQAVYALRRPAGALSPTTVNKILGTAKRIIREAQFNEKWGPVNPFLLVKKLPKAGRLIRRDLSLDEARAVLAHLRPDRRREALAMLYLGLRTGELKALQVSDIDSTNHTITIRRSNDRNQTKTGAQRFLPIPDALWPALEEAMDEAKKLFPDSELIFPARNGGLQRYDTKMSRALKAALVRAGLVTGYWHVCRRKGCGYSLTKRQREEGRCPKCDFKLLAVGQPIPVDWYGLRHSAATLHRAAGADPLAVQIALGHAKESVTDSVYTHLTFDDVRRELNKLRI